MDRIREALVDYWGEQCPDYNPDCACCQAWAELEALTPRITGAMIDHGAHSLEMGTDLNLSWEEFCTISELVLRATLPEPPASAIIPV